MLNQYNQFIESPLGLVEVTASAEGLTAVRFCEALQKCHPNHYTQQICEQLQAYFANQLTEFSVPLCPQGTPFQQQVWRALTTIQYGETASYGDIARYIKNEKAVRAVGMANGRNPIAIVIPCHRIIGSNGTLTGYAGGLTRKAYLLALEKQERECP
ncbi:methylated-DNA--[protein]-cysteine S-methyltransferase [Alteromonas ponticola]|uniref:Methylated-DNA--protein-cysteine methyltransferase n=1 Tax=Alteromonas aquimaris TaxID=2998417 RepID=A0ABT3P8I1_9ALTE|nr:methylated-DNA--[protein]-cysteine S-methyltransferase [Alteromonas aquimaris]MCW8109088.1 methylated-DNA--[protein]-cysteine S-methyltransferase [Alteromonas aquimaris]